MKIKRAYLFGVLAFCQMQMHSQFFKGIGVYGALTESRHRYINKDEDKRDFTPSDYTNNPNYYNTQSYVAKERFSWGAGVFAEFSTIDRVRWQTELAYTNKGSKERQLQDPFFGVRESGFGTNKFTYIQWNNYLKFFNKLGYMSNCYYMLGVRAEYAFRSSTPVNAPYSGAKPKIWFSGDAGIGFEFPLYKKINWFNEYHWNNDIWNPKKGSTVMRNRTFEIRVGLVYRPKKRSIDDCNAPKYNGPAY